MKKSIIAFCIISLLSISNLSAQSNQYKNLLKDYMEAAGTLDNFQSALENMIDMYKTNAAFKDIPVAFGCIPRAG